jgi:hypothetical protein
LVASPGWKLRPDSGGDTGNLERDDLGLARGADGRRGLSHDIDGGRKGGRYSIRKFDSTLRMDAGERIDRLMTDRATFPLVVQDGTMSVARI